MNSTSQASDAATTQAQLSQSYSNAGLPLLAKVLSYSRGALAKGGLPDYVNKGYNAARVGALEQAQGEADSRRPGLVSGPTESLAMKAPAFAGAAANYARENASISTSKALATVSQRNQLLNTMLGQGATQTDLSAGFGSMTNRALKSGLDSGNPAYEATVGGLSTGIPLLLTALMKTNGSDLETAPLGGRGGGGTVA